LQVATAMMNGEPIKDGAKLGDIRKSKSKGNTILSDNPENPDVENTKRLVKLGLGDLSRIAEPLRSGFIQRLTPGQERCLIITMSIMPPR
jgi:hypothetical protein